MFDLEFKNETCNMHGVYVVQRPNIPAPKKKISYVDIPGRDGELPIDEKTHKNIEISVNLNYMVPEEEWSEKYRECKKWFRDGGFLSFTDDQQYCYEVVHCEIDINERDSLRIGKFTVTFVCKPYMLIKDGLNPVSISNLQDNQYDVSHPIYKIIGEGMCTITVNGKSITANVGQNLTIDTNLMISSRQDGTVINTAITGSYKNLYLQEGKNVITATSGFTVSIIPRWRIL